MARARDSEEEFIDHYAVLCLPTGEEGANLTLKQIEKAYRDQSRKRHPDKRPDDPDATADFQRLTSSFEVIRDPAARAAFDSRLRSRLEKEIRDSLYDSKRRKLASDLESRERAAEEPDPVDIAARKEKMVAAELQRELADFKARNAMKRATPAPVPSMSREENEEKKEGAGLYKERTLKVTWERDLGDYSSIKLTQLFEKFGVVEDVVISKGTKKKGSALIVMSSKDAAELAVRVGDISNRLHVLPLKASSADTSRATEPASPRLKNIIGSGFQDYEASIMKKLEKAKEKKSDD